MPVDLGATPSSGISAIAYGNLKRHLGLGDDHTRIYDVVQQLAQPEDVILDRFGVDAIDLGRAFNTDDAGWYDMRMGDGQPAQYPAWFHPERQLDGSFRARSPDGAEIAHMPAGSTYFDQTFFPYLDEYPPDFRHLDDDMRKIPWAALVHSPWDHAGDPAFWDTLREKALALRQSSDRALMIVVGCNLFEWGTFLRRIDGFLCDLAAEPGKVEALLDALMQRHQAMLENVCRAVGDIADICRFGDDLGTNGGPFMSPAMYRRFFQPRHAQLCAYVHRHSRMKTFLHSCGSIRALLPDLIAAGFEVINPVQTNCRDMEPERLTKEFGRDVCFWGGGCDTRHVLPRGSPADVKRHVHERLEIFAPGGGFVFNPVHNILPDVPPRNIVAMFEAVAEFNGAR
ncbi:MAG: uroporphyrinogen decarboxylase family protein [Opitutaceae bacterium]|nr:uroporphyrinogen decarboxylase family protein [Opitutaceae bacterium]